MKLRTRKAWIALQKRKLTKRFHKHKWGEEVFEKLLTTKGGMSDCGRIRFIGAERLFRWQECEYVSCDKIRILYKDGTTLVANIKLSKRIGEPECPT